MNAKDSMRYDTLVCDSARMLATQYKKDVRGLKKHLKALGCTDEGHLAGVHEMQTDKDYDESADGYGLIYDEGVYESIKDCLRPLYGF
jgi:hypothetical protein